MTSQRHVLRKFESGRVADFDLARCGYHPVAIAPNARDVAALEALFRP